LPRPLRSCAPVPSCCNVQPSPTLPDAVSLCNLYRCRVKPPALREGRRSMPNAQPRRRQLSGRTAARPRSSTAGRYSLFATRSTAGADSASSRRPRLAKNILSAACTAWSHTGCCTPCRQRRKPVIRSTLHSVRGDAVEGASELLLIRASVAGGNGVQQPVCDQAVQAGDRMFLARPEALLELAESAQAVERVANDE